MHIMLDLETFSTEPNADIASIGAVAFNKDGIKDTFYRTTTIQNYSENLQKKFDISRETVLWWMRQPEKAKNMLLTTPASLYPTLEALKDWMRGCSGDEDEFSNIKVWGNSAAFDNVILRHAYKVFNIPLPWEFWNDRCYRTVKAIYPKIDMEFKGTKHNALDDATFQAMYLLELNKAYPNILGED